MQDSFIPDETDLKVIEALQRKPRASWDQIGRLLGINPVTAARRWQALTDAGFVQVTAYPTVTSWAKNHCNAFIEVDLEPTVRDHAVEILAHVPQIVSISIISSGRDLFLTLLTPDLATLSRVVLKQLHQLPGLRRTRTYTVTTVYGEGKHWRLGALESERRTMPPTQDGAVWKPNYQAVLRALGDGRRSTAEIATAIGRSEPTARRRLNEMIEKGLLSFRCEVAQPITGWPIAATFWARVPPNQLDKTAKTLAALPEVRMCAAVTGTDNLIMVLWLRSLGDIQRLEVQLATQLPQLTLTDRAVTLYQAKRMSSLLDETGHITGVIPVDPWAPHTPPTT